MNQSTGANRTSRTERLWSGINQSPRATLLVLLLFYLAIATFQAGTKLLWGDELITLAIARQGSLTGIWRALASGADPNPPLSHWLVLVSTSLFGQSALAIRLPSILCMLLALVSIWAILRRWVSPGYAALGLLAFMATRGFDYAYDARSYALLAGFTMAGVALWLYFTDARASPSPGAPFKAVLWPWPGFLALAAALALVLSSNYYGALAFILIAVAEFVRSLQSRRPNAGVWLALVLAALPLRAFQPLIRHNLAEFGPHAWNRPRLEMLSDSYLVLVEGVLWPVLFLAAYTFWRHRTRPAPRTCALRPHELTVVGILILYPVLGYVVALTGHAMISPRCVIPVCCGFALAGALLACHVFAPSPRAGLTLLVVAVLWVGAREAACAWILAKQRTAFLALRDRVAAEPANRPILLADTLVNLPLAHYSSPAIRDRMLVPIDFPSIHRYESDDSGEQNLWAGNTISGLYPIRITPYDPSLFASATLTVLARPEGWLALRLAGDGYRLTPAASQPAWDSLGGIFTPLGHPETRLLTASHP